MGVSVYRQDIYERVFHDLNANRLPGAILHTRMYSGDFTMTLRTVFPERQLYGLEIDLSLTVFRLPEDEKTHIIELDAGHPEQVRACEDTNQIPAEETFALLIDNGVPNRSEDIEARFVLWGHRIAPDGYYIIEDIYEDDRYILQDLLVPLGAEHGIHWELVKVRADNNLWDEIMLIGRRKE